MPSEPHPDAPAAPAPRRKRRRSLRGRAKRLVFRVLRAGLLRYSRAPARPGRLAGADRRVLILLASAWGMGGTIRTVLNVAGHLAAQGYDVEILSAYRRRDTPFFGAFPPGVKVTALDDRRDGAAPRGPLGLVRRLLVGVPTVLVHRNDRLADNFNLWTDVRLARRLRRRSGFLIGTRPGLNMLVAQVARPGLIAIGEEHVHMENHGRSLRRAMPRIYPRLDALAVLTERDRREYEAALDGRVRIARIPNAVSELGGGRADLSARTVLAAGRFRMQKGFDLLIPAFAQVAPAHPDWRLRICGSGRMRGELEGLIAEHGLADAVILEGPAERLGDEMERASVFALSSRFEGFPLILLEAMSKGMGVVSFDCPTGPADIIADHRNGILVPERDVDAFATGLRQMIEDEELRRRCGEAAIETAAQYRMDAIGPQWVALLRELHEERAASGAA